MTEFLVVRHGQSVADIEKRHEGRADFPLTELGRKQAISVAEWIAKHYPAALILASPLKRAAETARTIAERLSISVDFDDDLMEFDNGVLAGLLKEEAIKKYPKPVGGRPPHECIPGGESEISFRARGEIAWSRIRHSCPEPDKRILIVSHGGMISMLFRCFLELPMNSNVWIKTSDTGIHLWRVDADYRIVVFSDNQEHLLTSS